MTPSVLPHRVKKDHEQYMKTKYTNSFSIHRSNKCWSSRTLTQGNSSIMDKRHLVKWILNKWNTLPFTLTKPARLQQGETETSRGLQTGCSHKAGNTVFAKRCLPWALRESTWSWQCVCVCVCECVLDRKARHCFGLSFSLTGGAHCCRCNREDVTIISNK